MGVAGGGKTAVGERLAGRLGIPFVEGDAFHPPGNIEKMSSGVPLDDADRWPWLDAIGAAIRAAPANVQTSGRSPNTAKPKATMVRSCI